MIELRARHLLAILGAVFGHGCEGVQGHAGHLATKLGQSRLDGRHQVLEELSRDADQALGVQLTDGRDETEVLLTQSWELQKTNVSFKKKNYLGGAVVFLKHMDHLQDRMM